MANVLEQLELLRKTPANWDGYEADAPKSECVDAAIRLWNQDADLRHLGSPYVMPTRTGGVLFAWHLGPHQLDIEVDSPTQAGFGYLNTETDEAIEGDFVLGSTITGLPEELKSIITENLAVIHA